MKFSLLLGLILMVSCTHERSPASLSDKSLAAQSFALGNIKASAQKQVFKDSTCFDIQLVMKGVEEKHAQPKNWSISWLDKNNKQHELSFNQRTPASEPKGETKIAPYGSYQLWQSHFSVCAKDITKDEIQSIQLFAKELPYNVKEGMSLHWTHD
jgi:hypothetical protein